MMGTKAVFRRQTVIFKIKLNVNHALHLCRNVYLWKLVGVTRGLRELCILSYDVIRNSLTLSGTMSSITFSTLGDSRHEGLTMGSPGLLSSVTADLIQSEGKSSNRS